MGTSRYLVSLFKGRGRSKAYRRRTSLEMERAYREGRPPDLKKARGHAAPGATERDRLHARQRRLLARYGPQERGQPALTPADVAVARRDKGDHWVTERLEEMKANHLYWTSRGESPEGVDDRYRGLAGFGKPRDQRAGHNKFAAWYWYHGRYGGV